MNFFASDQLTTGTFQVGSHYQPCDQRDRLRYTISFDKHLAAVPRPFFLPLNLIYSTLLILCVFGDSLTVGTLEMGRSAPRSAGPVERVIWGCCVLLKT